MKKTKLFCGLFAAFVWGSEAWAFQEPKARFIENKNQWPDGVRFRAGIPEGFLYVMDDGFTYAFYDTEKLNQIHQGRRSPAYRENAPDKYIVNSHAYNVKFLGAETSGVSGELPGEEKYNFFLGEDETLWASEASPYGAVYFKNLYKGIDMRYFMSDGNLKYEFYVAAGTKTDKIRMQFSGADQLFLKDEKLFIKTSLNEIVELKPVSYQTIDGVKMKVETSFSLENNVLGFVFPKSYSKKHPLVIDPELVFSTYSGATGDNWGNTATHDLDGNLFSAGTIFNPGFPITSGAFQTNFSGVIDIAILKFDAFGKQLLYSTFLGGRAMDVPHSITVNTNNELLVMGTTSSDNFPTTRDAYDRSFAGGPFDEPITGMPYDRGSDIFVSSFTASGNTITGSTYLGGTSNDGFNQEGGLLTKNYGDHYRGEIITDKNNNIYLASQTRSSNFPIVNGQQRFYAGNQDGVLVKFPPLLNTIEWSTFLGGVGTDGCNAIQLDNTGKVVVAGGTSSSNLPVTLGVHGATYRGGIDGFVSTYTPGGVLVACSYVGTSAYDQAFYVDMDESNNIVLYGQTKGNYPVVGNVLNTNGGGQFLHKLSNDLKTTVFSTAFGSGNNVTNLVPTAFLVSDCGNIYLSGWGGSINSVSPEYLGGTTTGLPVTANAFQKTTDGSDFYLMILKGDASEIVYATFMGQNGGRGEHVDGGTSRFDKQGIIYHSVCACGGSGFPTTPGAWSNTNRSNNCNNAAFKFDLSELKADFKANVTEGCGPLTVSFTNNSVGLNYFWDFGDGTVSSSSGNTSHVYTKPGTYIVRLRVNNPEICDKDAIATDTIKVNGITQMTLSASQSSICRGDTVQINAGGGDKYAWSPATGLSAANIANPKAFPLKTTTYQLKITDKNGCTKDTTLTINVAFALFEKKLVQECDKLPLLTLTNKSEQMTKFVWDMGDGTVLTDQNPQPYLYKELGQYFITLTASNAICSRVFKDTIKIEFQSNIEFLKKIEVSKDQAICEGEKVPLFAKGGVKYVWTPSDFLDNPNSATPTSTPNKSIRYKVRIYNVNNCFADSSVFIEVSPEIKMDVSLKIKNYCSGLPEVKLINNSTGGATSFVWIMGNGDTLYKEKPNFYAYKKPGIYTVKVILSNKNCREEFTQRIAVEDIFAPNVFTPNQDGMNEKLDFHILDDGWKLEVYNGWGKSVYQNGSYKNDWDGGGLPDGVYHYLLTSPRGDTCKNWLYIVRGGQK